MQNERFLELAIKLQIITKQGWELYKEEDNYFLTNNNTGDNIIIKNAEHSSEILSDFKAYQEMVILEMHNNGQLDNSGLSFKTQGTMSQNQILDL